MVRLASGGGGEEFIVDGNWAEPEMREEVNAGLVVRLHFGSGLRRGKKFMLGWA